MQPLFARKRIEHAGPTFCRNKWHTPPGSLVLWQVVFRPDYQPHGRLVILLVSAALEVRSRSLPAI